MVRNKLKQSLPSISMALSARLDVTSCLLCSPPASSDYCACGGAAAVLMVSDEMKCCIKIVRSLADNKVTHDAITSSARRASSTLQVRLLATIRPAAALLL